MTPPSFNLLNEPWIPVEDSAGQNREVPLKGLFEEASRLRRIVHHSPVVTAALYRMLFSVMHRALALEDTEEWEQAWDEADYLPAVTSYLDRYADRFDLFHPEKPFWQVTNMPENCRPFSWTKLAIELPPNSSKLLFDHTLASEPPTSSPAEAARVLIAAQSFAVGAGKSCLGYTYHAPLVAALVAIPEGRNLEETLLANAMPSASSDDRPVWELPALTASDVENQGERTWEGPASRSCWLSRAVRLMPEESGGVRWIQFGMGFRALVADGDRDPWVSYRVTNDGKRIARKLDPERMVWRDFHGILAGTSDGAGQAVEALSRLRLLVDSERQPPKAWTVLVAGVFADRANVKAWRQERWSVPESVIRDDVRLATLGRAMHLAEEVGGQVRSAVFRVAFELLGGQGTANQSEAGRMAEKLPALSVYWSSLEARFQQLLQGLGGDVDDAEHAWFSCLIDAVQDASRATHAALGRDAKALKAWAVGGQRFSAIPARLRRQASELTPGEIEEVPA